DQRVADYRQSLVDRMAQGMLNDRFAEIARRPDAKFLGAGAGTQSLTPNVEIFGITARTADDRIEEGMSAAVAEAKRARDFGFSTSELERMKKNLLAGYEQIYAERDKSESPSFAQELLSLFLTNEPAPGIAYEYELVKELLPTITTSDVAASIRQAMKDEGK